MPARPPSVSITIGRIVHFYDEARGEKLIGPFAALVTDVYEDFIGAADLRVYHRNKADDCDVLGVQFSTIPKAGHWTWPPRG